MTTSAKGAVSASPQDLMRVGEYLNEQVLLEMTLEVRMMLLAAASGTNIHLLGPSGIAKSLGLREFARCIVGSGFFEKNLNAGMPADAVIGAYDMSRFVKTGEFTRNVDGFLPTADIGFIDEMFRANGPTQDALLPMANSEERQYEHNGGMHKSGLLLFASASNHMPDADNEQATALVDRITIVLHVERLKARDSFKELVRRHQTRTIGNLEGTWEANRVTITVEQLREVQRLVKYVDRSDDSFLDALADLRDRAFHAGLGISDRRWVEMTRIMQAVAWMRGSDACAPEDCAIAEFGMATDPDHRSVAHELVLPFLGRYEKAAVEKEQEAAGPLAEWAALRPLVEGKGADLPDEVTKSALLCTRKIDEVKERVDKVIAEAEAEKRDASRLRELSSELLAVQKWFYNEKMPTAYGR
jgi:MoxR-like ATPase